MYRSSSVIAKTTLRIKAYASLKYVLEGKVTGDLKKPKRGE